MATPLTDKINSLTSQANGLTGKSDKTLSDAVNSLIDGYGHGDPAILTTKNITLNGSYSAEDDSADGYSAVMVNVQNGASIAETQNAYGTEINITSAPGSAPSATRHTLYFEYEDGTTETVYAYYDDALIGSAITATTPTTRDGKTVTLAELDGVEWYSYTPTPTPGPTPSDDWVQVYNGSITISEREFELQNVTDAFTLGDKWRVTIDGTEYTFDVAHDDEFNTNYIGNIAIIRDRSNTGDPVVMYNIVGHISGNSYLDGEKTLKVEKQSGGE